jgi:hypothetical protein
MFHKPWLGLMALFALAVTSRADEPRPASSAAEIARFIAQLGDDSYQAREAASEQLIEAGLAARPAVQKALDDPDPEVRLRSRRILGEIELREEQRIVQAFLDEKDPNKDHGLSGWKRFREIVGDTTETRAFYVELHKAEKPLLAALDRGSKDLGESFAARLAELQQSHSLSVPTTGRRSIPLASSTALLFVATDEKVDLTNQNIHFLIYQSDFYRQLSSVEQLSSSEQRDMLRKVLGKFVAREGDAAVTYQNLNLALRFDLKEALGPGIKLALDEKATAVYRLYGLLAVAKFGDKEHAKAIEPLFKEQTVVYSRPGGKTGPSTTQIRDGALAAALHLQGQKLHEFGFAAQSHPQLLYLPNSLGFAGDAQRSAAFEKYRDWVKSLSKPGT